MFYLLYIYIYVCVYKHVWLNIKDTFVYVILLRSFQVSWYRVFIIWL